MDDYQNTRCIFGYLYFLTHGTKCKKLVILNNIIEKNIENNIYIYYSWIISYIKDLIDRYTGKKNAENTCVQKMKHLIP